MSGKVPKKKEPKKQLNVVNSPPPPKKKLVAKANTQTYLLARIDLSTLKGCNGTSTIYHMNHGYHGDVQPTYVQYLRLPLQSSEFSGSVDLTFGSVNVSHCMGCIHLCSNHELGIKCTERLESCGVLNPAQTYCMSSI